MSLEVWAIYDKVDKVLWEGKKAKKSWVSGRAASTAFHFHTGQTLKDSKRYVRIVMVPKDLPE